MDPGRLPAGRHDCAAGGHLPQVHTGQQQLHQGKLAPFGLHAPTCGRMPAENRAVQLGSQSHVLSPVSRALQSLLFANLRLHLLCMRQAMRLFVGEPVWTPINRPNDEHDSRKRYMTSFSAAKAVSANISAN